MIYVIIIAISILILVTSIYFIKIRFINTKKIKDLFKVNNLVVCGKKGSGKDTLFSYVTKHIKHNCNVPLHKDTNIILLKDVMIPSLTRQKLTNIEKLNLDYEKYKIFENMTLISDSQLYFPSYDDSKLKQEYPYLANTYSIWRHLYNAPLHFNTQNLERLWKILREQIEEVIMCLDVRYGLFYVKAHVRYYERCKDAIDGKKPLKMSIFRKEEMKEVEDTLRWEIKDYTLLYPKRYCQQDSYYFKKIVFKESEE